MDAFGVLVLGCVSDLAAKARQPRDVREIGFSVQPTPDRKRVKVMLFGLLARNANDDASPVVGTISLDHLTSKANSFGDPKVASVALQVLDVLRAGEMPMLVRLGLATVVDVVRKASDKDGRGKPTALPNRTVRRILVESEHAAECGPLLEYRDAMAFLKQFFGRDDPRGARPDHRDMEGLLDGNPTRGSCLRPIRLRWV